MSSRLQKDAAHQQDKATTRTQAVWFLSFFKKKPKASMKECEDEVRRCFGPRAHPRLAVIMLRDGEADGIFYDIETVKEGRVKFYVFNGPAAFAEVTRRKRELQENEEKRQKNQLLPALINLFRVIDQGASLGTAKFQDAFRKAGQVMDEAGLRNTEGP